jgi:hypothetical protein
MMAAYEERSREFFQEREEKKKLEVIKKYLKYYLLIKN